MGRAGWRGWGGAWCLGGALIGCGSSAAPPGGSGASGGSAGTSASGGTAGTSASGGTAGTSASGGSAGAATGGTAGTGGAGGTTSAGGTTATGGTAGAAATGGTSGAAGSGGSAGAAPTPDTALGWIRALPAPTFRAGHTLPPLTYASCTFSLPEQVEFETELVERFGYAYSLHRATPYWNSLLDNPSSDIHAKVQRHLGDPARYPLFTSVMRPHWEWEERATGTLDQYLTDLGARCSGCAPALLTADSSPPADVVFSPAADPRYYDLLGDDTAATLGAYRDRGIALSVVLNLGEVGVGLSMGSCFNGRWNADPAVAADALAFLGVSALPACDTEAWARYASHRYGRLQQRITDKVRAALPAGALYLYYRTEGNLNRERYGSWYDWAPWFEDTQGNSSHPNMSAYYAGDEPPYLYWDTASWDPNTDMLTGTLASVAYQVAAGAPLAYSWVSGGWPTASHPEVSPADRYLGYLKALYLAGHLGAVAAWWSPGLWQAGGGWSCDPGATLDSATLPDGLAQLVALGEAHALFSHFEAFLRQGRLVPGPALHRFTRTLPASRQVPAYELNCDAGTGLCDRTHRVLARKLDAADAWLVVAWAASGPDTDVTVTLPGWGALPVRARAAGSLYHVVGTGPAATVTLVDADPLHPTAGLSP